MRNIALAFLNRDLEADQADAVGYVNPTDLIQKQHLDQVAGAVGTEINRVDEVATDNQTTFNIVSDTIPYVAINGVAMHYPTDFGFADGVVTLNTALVAGDYITALGWAANDVSNIQFSGGSGAGAGGVDPIYGFGGAYSALTYHGPYSEFYWTGLDAGRWTASCSLSGDGLVVAFGYDVSNSGGNGKVRIYDVHPDTREWALRYEFTIETETLGQSNYDFGVPSVLNHDGSKLILGSRRDEREVWFYDIGPTSQTFTGTLDEPDGAISDNASDFGFSIALSDNEKVMAISMQDYYYFPEGGATGNTDGLVLMYDYYEVGDEKKPEGGWGRRDYVLLTDELQSDDFGRALALSGDGSVLAVTQPVYSRLNTRTNAEQVIGGVYIYDIGKYDGKPITDGGNPSAPVILNFTALHNQPVSYTHTFETKAAAQSFIDSGESKAFLRQVVYPTQYEDPEFYTGSGFASGGLSLTADGTLLAVGAINHRVGPLTAAGTNVGGIYLYDLGSDNLFKQRPKIIEPPDYQGKGGFAWGLSFSTFGKDLLALGIDYPNNYTFLLRPEYAEE